MVYAHCAAPRRDLSRFVLKTFPAYFVDFLCLFWGLSRVFWGSEKFKQYEWYLYGGAGQAAGHREGAAGIPEGDTRRRRQQGPQSTRLEWFLFMKNALFILSIYLYIKFRTLRHRLPKYFVSKGQKGQSYPYIECYLHHTTHLVDLVQAEILYMSALHSRLAGKPGEDVLRQV